MATADDIEASLSDAEDALAELQKYGLASWAAAEPGSEQVADADMREIGDLAATVDQILIDVTGTLIPQASREWNDRVTKIGRAKEQVIAAYGAK